MAVTTVKGIIKMPDEGDTITMHVVKCEVVEGKFGEQIKFTNSRGDALFISRQTADRQLARCGFVDQELILYGDVDGHTLIFSRDHNKSVPSKPYWSIQTVVDPAHRPSLTEQAKAEAEKIRVQKGLPDDEGNTIGKLPFDDVPPPTDADNPYSEDDGLPVVRSAATDKPDPKHAKREAMIESYRVAVAASWDVWGEDANPEVVQAGAATIFIQFAKAGVA